MRLSQKLSSPITGSPFYGRPLFLFSVVFLVSLFLIGTNFVYLIVFAALVLIYSVTRICIDYKDPERSVLLPVILVCAVLLGTLPGLTLISEQNKVKMFKDQTVSAELEVKEVYYSEIYGSAYHVRIKTVNGEKVDFDGVLEIVGQYDIYPFNGVNVTAVFHDYLAENSGSEVLMLKSEKIYAGLECVSVDKITPPEKSLEYEIYRFRQSIGSYFDSILDHGSSAFARALFVGDKSELPDYFRRDMSALGISHILAVSGLHTSIIASVVMIIVQKLRMKRKTAAITVSIVGLFYIAVAGFSYSVTRAVIMLIYSVIPFFFGRKGDSLTSLGVSGIIICLISPEAVLSCSFLLSFSASLGIVLCASYVNRRANESLTSSRASDMKLFYKYIKNFLMTLVVSISATFFTVPVIALYYREISVVAVIANIVAIPCANIAVILILFILPLGKIPFVGKALCTAFEWIYHFLVYFSGGCAKLFKTTVSLNYPFFYVICILFCCMVLFLRLRKVRKPSVLFIPFLCCLIIFTVCFQINEVQNQDRAEILYTVRKNSDGFVLCSGSKVMYVDVGDGTKSLQFYAKDAAFEEYSKTGLDGYMLTHYHSRHIGTLRNLLSVTRIDTIYLPYPETENEVRFYKSLILMAEKENIVMYRRGESVTFGNITVDTVPYTILERSAHPVMSLKFTSGNSSLVFLGSAVSESENFAEITSLSSGCRSFIIGRQGPVTKENSKMFGIDQTSEVWLSPFEDTDEKILLPECDYHTLETDKDGYLIKKFVFN